MLFQHSLCAHWCVDVLNLARKTGLQCVDCKRGRKVPHAKCLFHVVSRREIGWRFMDRLVLTLSAGNAIVINIWA